MTDDEVDDYVRYLWERLPPSHGRLTVEQVRAVLDAEAAYYERRFGPIRGWRALLREMFGRGDPSPATVEATLPDFERYVVDALAPRGDLTREDIRAIMRVEGESGPYWTPPPPPKSEGANTEEGA